MPTYTVQVRRVRDTEQGYVSARPHVAQLQPRLQQRHQRPRGPQDRQGARRRQRALGQRPGLAVGGEQLFFNVETRHVSEV